MLKWSVDKLIRIENGQMNGDENVIYCCTEHVDMALDDVVDEHEVAPKLEKLESVENSSVTCGYCGKPAVYMVGNE